MKDLCNETLVGVQSDAQEPRRALRSVRRLWASTCQTSHHLAVPSLSSVALVLLLVQDRAPAEIDTGAVKARLDGLGLSRHLSSNRTQGLASMLGRIGELAA